MHHRRDCSNFRLHVLPHWEGLFNWKSTGPPAFAGGLEFCDQRFVAQGEPDVVKTFEQPPPSVIVNLERKLKITDGDSSLNQIDGRFYSRVRIDGGSVDETVLRGVLAALDDR